MSRQNYYQRRRQRGIQQVREDAVVSWVKRERRMQPKLGGLKLKARMKGLPFELGRDRLFKVLRENDLLVKHEPSKPRTTNSYHCLPVFTNRIAAEPAKAPNEVWVSDLTYIDTMDGFRYLFLISDQYSRKIVGYHLSERMETSDAIQALEMAVEDLPTDKRPCHHSDRGCQYCSHEYIGKLAQKDLSVSMTEQNHCYENAQAERLNGILKQEYGLGQRLRSAAVAHSMVEQAVWLYNHYRPHRSLCLDYPSKVHEEKIAAPMGANPSLN
jgi:transposase InsO family protein